MPKPGVADLEESLDKKIEEAIAKAQQEDQVVCIAPRKPNWDLKRDLERKLEPLQAKTDKAMIQLIRMQLQKEGGGDANLPSQEKAVTEATFLAARTLRAQCCNPSFSYGFPRFS